MNEQLLLLLGYSTQAPPIIISQPEEEAIALMLLRLAEIDLAIKENSDLLLVEQVGDIKLTSGKYLDLLKQEAQSIIARISHITGKPILYNPYGSIGQTYSVRRYW